MSAQPFLAFSVCRKRDVIRARNRARQIASLLRYSPHEQACIAAGTFAIACQALVTLGRRELCFQIESRQLQVYIREPVFGDEALLGIANRTAAFAAVSDPTLRLVKPLPEDAQLGEADLGWLVQHTDEPCEPLFDEIIRQNQEVLGLLHELYIVKQQVGAQAGPSTTENLPAGVAPEQKTGGQPVRPTAA